LNDGKLELNKRPNSSQIAASNGSNELVVDLAHFHDTIVKKNCRDAVSELDMIIVIDTRAADCWDGITVNLPRFKYSCAGESDVS